MAPVLCYKNIEYYALFIETAGEVPYYVKSNSNSLSRLTDQYIGIGKPWLKVGSSLALAQVYSKQLMTPPSNKAWINNQMDRLKITQGFFLTTIKTLV